jgi:hypothetical protein
MDNSLPPPPSPLYLLKFNERDGRGDDNRDIRLAAGDGSLTEQP